MTRDCSTNPDPLTVNQNSGPPQLALVGDIDVTLGIGLVGGGAVLVLQSSAVPSATDWL